MNTNKKITISLSTLIVVALPLSVSAAENNTGTTPFANPLFNALLAVIIMLAIIVLALGGALRNLISSDMFVEKLKKQKQDTALNKKALLGLLLLFSAALFAENKTATESDNIGGLQQPAFYTMLTIIALELLVIGVMFNIFRRVLGESKAKKVAGAKKKVNLLDKINATVAIEEEEAIMLDHEYDGIRELDNDLPPWWKYGFYLTILVAVVYMVAYHVTDSLPLQKKEYQASLAKAEKEVAEYMKNSANNVDETTVKLLTEAADLKTGQDLFIASCAACHGRAGEGGVGPNLTDEYWMHKGGIADIFKSIKYGWPDKGMKSWKDDFSPMQISQMTSYIKSLAGSNPPNAKEQQGELYVEEAPAGGDKQNDSTSATLTSQLPN